MLSALYALSVLAAAPPKVVYQPNKAAASDVGTIALTPPSNPACFEAALAQLMVSSRKSDRTQGLFLSVTLAEAQGNPSKITGAAWGEANAALPLVNLRVGDVACHDYVCPTGSTAIFALDPAAKAAALAGTLVVKVSSTIGAGSGCLLPLPVPAAPVEALDRWAADLPKP